MSNRKKIIVVGGGFAGIQMVRRLDENLFDVLLIDKIISLKEEEREAYLNLVIVGAGATGVELAGAFAEIKKNVLPKDYPWIDFTKFQIYLVEGSKNTLNNMSNVAQNASNKYLQKMGVQLLTEKFVTEYDGGTLTLSNGDKINTKTVIWAAGVTGNYAALSG